jgi:hypothetical protein
MDQKVVEKNIADLEAAIKALGETSKAMNGQAGDRQVIGAVLGASIGIAAQLYGVETVKAILHDFVTGELSAQFWALQSQLHASEKKKDAPEGPGLAKVPSAPGSVPAP